MKTIEDLNKNWWYRMLKVVFVMALIFGLFSGFGIALEEAYPDTYEVLDRENTTITCLNGNRETHSMKKANSFNDISLSASDFDTYKNSNGKVTDNFPFEVAEKLCDLEGPHVSQYECNRKTPPIGCIGGQIAEDPDDVVPRPRYSLNKTYKEVQTGSVGGFILALLLWITGLFITEELVRRSFYYISLGKFFPKK